MRLVEGRMLKKERGVRWVRSEHALDERSQNWVDLRSVHRMRIEISQRQCKCRNNIRCGMLLGCESLNPHQVTWRKNIWARGLDFNQLQFQISHLECIYTTFDCSDKVSRYPGLKSTCRIWKVGQTNSTKVITRIRDNIGAKTPLPGAEFNIWPLKSAPEVTYFGNKF